MDGSAAVIGEMMLPILEPLDAAAFLPARHLGLAFQLTNFLRDVDEDLDRGRVYLPQEDLDRFGVDPWTRSVTPAWVELMRFEIDRARQLYRAADAGHRRCSPTGRRAASRPPASCTPRSSTASRAPTTTCSPRGSVSRPRGRCGWRREG